MTLWVEGGLWKGVGFDLTAAPGRHKFTLTSGKNGGVSQCSKTLSM